MKLVNWVRDTLAPRTVRDDKYEQAISLTDEVTEKMRERARSPDPFRALMADLFLQHHDIALVADAFEASQESKIYRGPTS